MHGCLRLFYAAIFTLLLYPLLFTVVYVVHFTYKSVTVFTHPRLSMTFVDDLLLCFQGNYFFLLCWGLKRHVHLKMILVFNWFYLKGLIFIMLKFLGIVEGSILGKFQIPPPLFGGSGISVSPPPQKSPQPGNYFFGAFVSPFLEVEKAGRKGGKDRKHFPSQQFCDGPSLQI